MFDAYGNPDYSKYSIGFYYKALLHPHVEKNFKFKNLAKSFAEIIPHKFYKFLRGIAILAFDWNYGGSQKAQIHFNNDDYVFDISSPAIPFNSGVSVLANVVVSICISIICAHVCSIS